MDRLRVLAIVWSTLKCPRETYCSRYEYSTKNRRNLSAYSKATKENTEKEETKEERVMRCNENNNNNNNKRKNE